MFQTELAGHLGDRTQRIGEIIADALKTHNIPDKDKQAIAEAVTDVFGKLDANRTKGSKNKLDVPWQPSHARTRQLAFVSPAERAKAIEITEKGARGEKLPAKSELQKLILQTSDGAADVAMFGRMLADAPAYNREAAVQVAHAFTTHRVLIENDYYTAVDDLKKPEEDAGAGFIGETGFGSGIFYLYGRIDQELLI